MKATYLFLVYFMLLTLPSEKADQEIEKKVAHAEIATRQPPVSAMPPMGLIMKKSEVRDLVAFLASLRKKDGKKGH